MSASVFNYQALSVSEKNKLAVKYEPLVSRMGSQFYKTVKCPWEDLRSMALEGLAIALNTYDPKKSNQTFIQFAAFAIRNNILTSLDEELRTVKLSAYAQEKIKTEGGTLFNSVSIDRPYQGDDDLKPRETVMGMYCEETFSNGDVFDYLYSRIEDEFSVRDYTIFYRHFGLKDYEVTPNKVIAQELGVSEGLISQRLKKIIDFIRNDRDLCEMLSSLLVTAK